MSKDNTTVFQKLKDDIRAFASHRNWISYHNPKNLSMALAGEAAELMEHFFWIENVESNHVLQDTVKREAVEDELADVLIYALQFANVGGIDVVTAIQRKMDKNAKKYPPVC